ncbi:hypothetical protein [Bdellovibrio sp. ZAP7]|uniref:hypothetical protein n=1 Tax=Bdellovibrio sp. ZAP7 TaxID=2231053 RepID=UPI00143DEBF4|nr:hypothetical protein [Bdellovibrio sp. ZAP7]
MFLLISVGFVGYTHAAVKGSTPQDQILMNPDSMRAINLEGVSVYYQNENRNVFPYQVKEITASYELLQSLIEQTDDDVILSKVYRGESNSFKDIYVYVSLNTVRPGSPFKINFVYINQSGRVSSVTMSIDSASTGELNLSHGPSDSKDYLYARPGAGNTFFPY